MVNETGGNRPGMAPAAREVAIGLDFRQLFESAPGAYLVLSPALVIQAVSNTYLAATMTQRADIVGRHLFDVFPDNPGDANATGVGNLSASLDRVLRTGQTDSMAVQKYDVRRPGGAADDFEERHWSPVNVPVRDADGRLVYIIHRVEDVTDYVRLEAAMRDGKLATAEMSARTVAMEAEVLRRAQELQLANRELRGMHEQLERRVVERTEALERSKAELQIEAQARRTTASELERIEGQLLQMQRLDAVGQLAGGIAHDFNNLLTVILGFESMARARLPAASPAIADLEQVRLAGERAAQLTNQLLTFSRKQLREMTNLDVNRVVEGLRPMLGRLVGESIDFRVRCTPGLGLVEANQGQIEQVIVNLTVNARDAMPNGGVLAIETSQVDLDAEFARLHLGIEPGPHALIAVTDTGCGMDQATQSRIFEPFFTTKSIGKGTGLGLSTVFGIVKQSRGHIWAYSEPGVGTTFKVFLPYTLATGALPVQTAVEPARSRSGETLLLAEDDEQVRMVAQRILQDAGYCVLPTKGPEEALAAARDPAVHFDAIVTDVVMPRMGGRQLAELVQAIRPGTAVLFMSGYTDDVVLQSGVRASQVAFVQKPLLAAALTRKVREVLDRRPDRAP